MLVAPGDGGPKSRIDDVIRPVMVLLLVSLAQVVLVNLVAGSLIAGRRPAGPHTPGVKALLAKNDTPYDGSSHP